MFSTAAIAVSMEWSIFVVTVHPVAPYKKKIWNAICPFPDYMHVFISSEIGGICLRHTHDEGIKQVCTTDQSDMFHLPCRKFDKLCVGHRPVIVTFIDEVLDADPHGVAVAGHVRAPVVEYQNAVGRHVAFLNIYPGVGGG